MQTNQESTAAATPGGPRQTKDVPKQLKASDMPVLISHAVLQDMVKCSVKVEATDIQCDKYFGSKELLSAHTCKATVHNKDDPVHISHEQLSSHAKETSENAEMNVLFECRQCKALHSSFDAHARHTQEHQEHVRIVQMLRSVDMPRDSIGSHFTPYQCSVCNKMLCSKGNLVKHQQIHAGSKPYTCHFCDKSFSLKGNRDKHQLIHDGKKPHSCAICGKAFNLKGNLQQHILTHTSLKMFKCKLCGSEFTLKGNLNKHMKRHENGLVQGRKEIKKQIKHVQAPNIVLQKVVGSSEQEEEQENSVSSTQKMVLDSVLACQ